MFQVQNPIQQLIEMSKQLDEPKDQIITNILAYSLDILKLDTAIVSQIKNRDYHVMYFYPESSGLSKGQIFKFRDTYCNITIKYDQLIDIPHMQISEHFRHPCYQVFQLESYIGVPLYIDNQLYGTVNFSSSNKRDEFTKTERMVVQKAAELIVEQLTPKA